MSEKVRIQKSKPGSRKVQDMTKGNGKKKEPKKREPKMARTTLLHTADVGTIATFRAADATTPFPLLISSPPVFQLPKNCGLIDRCVALCPSPSSVFSVLRTPDSILCSGVRTTTPSSTSGYRASRESWAFPLILVSLYLCDEEKEGA